jgi:probable F420-dependent oxidoreductase
VHLGIILPNFGKEPPTRDGVRAVAETAEELGFDSAWATEHIIVGPEGVDPYGQVFAPLVTLGWIAGYTERIALGTSIVLVPLHHPIHLAKEVATLQLLSGRRVHLGVGMGWHEDEFRFMGEEFRGRGRRANEALRLMKALWAGERSFQGEHWSFEDATFGPLPPEQPEIWVGGSSEPALRRARELGDVWHSSRGSSVDHVRQVKERFPELRAIPRVSGRSADDVAEKVEAYLGAGCEGAVVAFAGPPERILASMREFAPRYR